MTGFWGGLIELLGKLLKWWVVVTPWEQAIRVKFGKHTALLGPGIHLKVPLVHTVFKQSVRLRSTALAVQTLSTRDGHTLTVDGILNYSIVDIRKLYNSLHHAEDTLRSFGMAAISQFVQTHDAAECTPERVAAGASAGLDLTKYGLACTGVLITGFAYVKTYRLIMDRKGDWVGGTGDALNTHQDISLRNE